MLPQATGTNQETEKRIDLVLEGGGVKGIALVGALTVLEEQGFQVQNRAGSSAGAIVATLHAAGYTAGELRDLLSKENFAALLDPTPFDELPLIGKPLSAMLDLGIYKGDRFLEQMRGWLTARNVHTFRDLLHPQYQDDQPMYRYQVQVVVTDVTNHRLLVLPRDAEALGIDPNDLDVALAVRMSMSTPILFRPVRWNNPKTGQEMLLLDGGLLSNFPVWIFDSQGTPEWPTFGLWLLGPEPQIGPTLPPAATAIIKPLLAPIEALRGQREGFIEFLLNLLWTMTDAHDRLYLDQDTFVRTITIPTLGVDSLHFTLSTEQTESLYASGRQAAKQFLQTWSFPAYIAAFRQQQAPGRREEVARKLQTVTARVGP